jgi:hypothetical protein
MTGEFRSLALAGDRVIKDHPAMNRRDARS